MVSLKNSFPRRYSQKSDSAQANTAWSQTLRRLTLRGVKLNKKMNTYEKHADFSKDLRKFKVG